MLARSANAARHVRTPTWQFTESSRLWSPDSQAIVYAAQDELGDSIQVREIDGDGPVRVSDGAVAFWSPG